jgi:hypothetical protein
VVAATTNGGFTSSVCLRDQISQALTTTEFPEGVPYFRVEGIAILRDDGGKYLGTLEVSQDLTGYRALEGEQRILSYA